MIFPSDVGSIPPSPHFQKSARKGDFCYVEMSKQTALLACGSERQSHVFSATERERGGTELNRANVQAKPRGAGCEFVLRRQNKTCSQSPSFYDTDY